MSEGATGGAPAAAAATGATTPTGTPPPAPEWGDKDDAELFERVSKAPWAKLKVNGKDEPIKTRADMERVLTDAQRGRGSNRVVEEANKARAEAAKEKADVAAERALYKRARQGDVAARRELGLIPDTEKEEQRKQWEALPPEVRAVIERNHELETKVQERERKDAEAAEAEKASKKKLEGEKLLTSARAHAKELLKDVKEDGYDVELPDILWAMRVQQERGLRLGVDYDAASLGPLIADRRKALLTDRHANLKPEVGAQMAVPHLKSLNAAQLTTALGADFDAIAKVFAEAQLARWRAGKKAAAKAGTQPEPAKEAPRQSTPLEPFRFGRR